MVYYIEEENNIIKIYNICILPILTKTPTINHLHNEHDLTTYKNSSLLDVKQYLAPFNTPMYCYLYKVHYI